MIDYIQNNSKAIQKYEQQSFGWNHANVDAAMIVSKDFREICGEISPNLARADVANYFKENTYKGFIASLLWGGRYKGRNAKRPFIEIISNNREFIETRMNRVKELVENGDIQNAFNSMTNIGDNYIRNIANSYFTKTLYFMSYFDDITPRPIILDYNLHWVNCLLAKDLGDNYQDLYFWDATSKEGKELVGKNGWQTFYFYNDYCIRMEKAAQTINVRPDKLEEFLFSNNVVDDSLLSPRQYIYSQTKELFNKQ